MIATATPAKGGSARFSVGLEEGSDGVVHAHALGLSGCMTTAGNAEDALAAFESELAEWLTFMSIAGRRTPPQGSEIEIAVDEWLRMNEDVGPGTIACFDADRAPLTRVDIEEGLDTLGVLRGRLLPRIRRARNEDLERLEGPRYTLRTILEELARAQWWTLSRLGASPLAAVPEQVVGRLDTAIALAVDRLASLDEERASLTLLLEGEEWTPRKVLRRLLWLEWSLGGLALRTMEPIAPREA